MSAKISTNPSLRQAIDAIDAHVTPNAYAMHITRCPECGDSAAQLCEDTGIITCIECLYFA